MKRMGRKRGLALGTAILVIALVAAATWVQPAYTDENINVSCYKGDKEEGTFVGTVMVFAPEAAGPQCNSLYYACKGKCYGCFSDFDLGGDVCYDSTGRRFLQ